MMRLLLYGRGFAGEKLNVKSARTSNRSQSDIRSIARTGELDARGQRIRLNASMFHGNRRRSGRDNHSASASDQSAAVIVRCACVKHDPFFLIWEIPFDRIAGFVVGRVVA